MSAGKRNRLITIQKPLTNQSDTGSISVVYEDFVTLWGYKSDKNSGAQEKSHSSTLYPVKTVEWVIRRFSGITPAMRVIYEGEIWEIIAVNDVSWNRSEQRLVCEFRGVQSDTPQESCPTLAERIAAADWAEIQGDLSAEQLEDAIAALCDVPEPCEDATVELNGTEVATVPSGDSVNIPVLQGGNPVGSLVGGEWIVPECDPCEDATYRNSDNSFSQEIASGATYTAPDITVTDVDGSTRASVPNIPVLCEWKVLTGKASDGTAIVNSEINAYPSNGEYILPDRRIADAGANVVILPYRQTTNLLNANLASAVNDTPNPEAHNITLSLISILNSDGLTLLSLPDFIGNKTLPDTPLSDDNGAVGSYPVPTSIVIDGEVNSASYAAGVLTIQPTGGAAPTTICPKLPSVTQFTSYESRDEGAAIAAGEYVAPTAPYAQVQALDHAAASPFTTLRHAHPILGGTARFRDSSNNPLAYGDATTSDGLVRDYLTDFEFYTIRQSATSVTDAHAQIAASTIAGGGWFAVPRQLLQTLWDMDNGNNANTVSGRPPGFDSNWHNFVMLATTYELITTNVYVTFSNGTVRRTNTRGKSNTQEFIMCRRMFSY